jgi:PIN domain
MQKPKFTVIPDTNILWASEKTDCVAPTFQAFWNEYSKAADFALFVPEVVIGELKYQHFESARKALDSARQQLDRLSAITRNQHHVRSTEERIRKQIDSKFRRWLKEIGANEIPIPTSKIDIQELAQSAIWRKSVFAPDAKAPDAEKGFRDALILESVVEYVHREPSKQVAFLCNDHLLRTSTVAALKSHTNLQAFESLEEFGSQIRLLAENLTQQFVKQISSRAAACFFAPDDPSTLFYSANVKGVIREEFNYELSLADSTEPSNSRQLHHGAWIISRPSFVEILNDDEYQWKSLVRTAIQFEIRKQRTILSTVDVSVTNLFLAFAVYWKARVRKDGRLQGAEIVEIKLDNRESRDASQEELGRYRLVSHEPPPPPPYPQDDES